MEVIDMTMERKDMFVGQLVRHGYSENARVVKVLDTAACDMWGNRMKRGRYVAVRAWDDGKGDFEEGSTRRGLKPAEAVSLSDWNARDARRAEEREKQREQARKEDAFFRPVYEELVRFLTSLGYSERAVYAYKRDIGGDEYIYNVSLRGAHREGRRGDWPDVTLVVLAELGIIPNLSEFEGV
jgi:hypothetical protein